jgi:hypothetical protein
LDMSSDTTRHIIGKLPNGPGSETNDISPEARNVYQAGTLQNRRPGRLMVAERKSKK